MFHKILLTTIFVLTLKVVVAQVPGTLSYQGFLTTTGGTSVEGDVKVKFQFYKGIAETIDPTLTRELDVKAYKGLFTVILGSGIPALNTPLPASLGDQPCSIGITYLGTELTPRAKLTTVPYAFVAQSANSIAATNITGTLPGTQVGIGIDATKITTGSLALANGGTGANTAALARTNLGVQAFDADLTDLADGTLSNAVISLTGTDASKLASGTTAQRPGTPVEGQLRYNTTEHTMEFHNGTDWYFLTPKVCYLKDVKPNGASGGTSIVSGSFQTRDLNTVEGDNTFVTLSANQFTLKSGAYLIEVSAPNYRGSQHKVIVRNISDSNNPIIGSSMYARGDATEGSNHSLLYGVLEIATAKIYEIQYRVNAGITDGLGAPNSFGVSEVYTQVKITKLR